MKNKTLIKVRELTHTFGKGEAKNTVLHNVDLDFYLGEIVIIMGPSGSGKTTLLTLVGALRSPQTGSILVNDTELYNATEEQQLNIRQGIGYIFQAHNLLDSLNACENVQMGLAHLDLPHEESTERALNMLKRVGLREHLLKHPRQLSIGQRQRVAIARALVRKPKIIIADEPTASLDSHVGREVVELLNTLTREDECLVLMVTHDTRILDIADRILTLEDGKFDESNRILERTREEITSVLQLISQYPEEFSSPDKENSKLQKSSEEIRKRLDEAHRNVMVLGARKLKGALSEQFTRLDRACENLLQIEEAVNSFCNQISTPPSNEFGEKIDPLFQSMEFLLITAAEALESNSEEDLSDLLMLTGDKSDMMEKLRKKYISGYDSYSREEEDFIFNVTQSFSLAVHFLHALAEVWGVDG